MDREALYVYQQIEQTTAQWQGNTTIYPASVWLFERLSNGKFNMKLSDGVKQFKDLSTVFQDVKVKVKTDNSTTYILTVTTAEGDIDTPNLRGKNGSIVTIDPTSKHMMIDGVDTGIKVEGSDGQSAYQLWISKPGNEGKTEEDYISWQQKPAVDAAERANEVVLKALEDTNEAIVNTNEAKDNAILATIGATEAAKTANDAAANVEDGKTPVISIGTVTEGESFDATITPDGVDDGGNPKSKLNLVLKPGKDGEPPVVNYSAVTGEAGTEVEVTQTQTGTTPEGSPIYSVVLKIPRGDKGTPGEGSGNVLVDAYGLFVNKKYLFQPKFSDSSEGSFVEYMVPDWNQSDPASYDYIKNKPTSFAPTKDQVESVLTGDISSHNHDNRYDTKDQVDAKIAAIPAQIQPDWNETEGLGEILNKPEIPNVPDWALQPNAPDSFPEAPVDGKAYNRKNKAWAEAIGSPDEVHIGNDEPTGEEVVWIDTDGDGLFDKYAVPEAPTDGKTYGRKNSAWYEVNSAYLDAVNKGYTGTKDEFDTLLAGISSKEGCLDISFLFDINGDPVTSITQKQLDLIVKAYNNKVSTVFWKKSVLPAAIYTSASGYNIAVSDIGYDKGVTHVSTLTLEITTINLSVHFKLGENDFELSGDGSKVLSDNGSYKKIFDIPNVDAPKDEYRYSRQSGAWKRSAYYLGHQILKLTKASSSADISAAIGGEAGFTRLLLCLTSYTPVFIATGDTNTGSLTPVAITGGIGSPPLDINITSTETLYNASLSKMVTRTVKRKIGRNANFSAFFYEEENLASGLDLYDVFTVTSLSSLSNTKYSQKYTYASGAAQPINFASAPAEGFECMLDIKNDSPGSMNQAIPNSPAWQCEETYIIIPPGKVGSISIRYIHGKYCVRVGF